MRALRTVALFAAMLAVPALPGQTIDGDVVGSVFDPAGASVPGASVELQNTATGVKSVVKTTADGTYRFSNVPIGPYAVTVNASGFAAVVVKDVQVELNKTTTVNAALPISAVKTDVTVVDAPALLNTTTAQI